MTMLHASEVLQRHPQGCWVFDATGRRLGSVFACDPETGEVITHDMPWVARAWMPLMWAKVRRRDMFDWRRGARFLHSPGEGCLLTRHGFWPAPLHLVPKRSEETRRLELACERLKDALAKLPDTSGTIPATPDEHREMGDAIAARRQAGGRVPDGQAYIVGNGDRDELLP